MPLLGVLIVVLLACGVYAIAGRRAAPARGESAATPLLRPQASWPARVGKGEPSAAERIAIVRRLGIVGSDWCVEVLEAALDDEHDADVRDAIWRALLELRAG